MSLFKTTSINKNQLDRGARLRVSQLTTLIDVKQINDNAPLYVDRVNGGGATQNYAIADGGTTMAVSANNDYAIAQTKMWSPYFAGKTQLMEITGSSLQNVAGVVKRMGYFSSSTVAPYTANLDGIWFEADGTDYRLKIYKDGTEIFNQPQSEWDNTFDEFDPSKFTVLIIDFFYLGGTAIRFGFIKDGQIFWVTEYQHANNVASTFVNSPNQPVRYEIRSSGGSSNMVEICRQVSTEGSIDEVGVQTPIDLGTATLNANTSGTYYAVAGCRLKAPYKNVTVRPLLVDILATTNDDFRWALFLNPTVAGTFEYSDLPNSALQRARGDVAGNPSANTITGGREVAFGYGVGNEKASAIVKSSLRIGSNIDGTLDTLVLGVTPMGGSSNLDVGGGFLMEEFL